MNLSAFLNRARHIDTAVTYKMEQAIDLRQRSELLSKLAPVGEHLQEIRKAQDELDALETEIIDEIQQLARCKLQIEICINRIPDPTQRALLTYRYLLGWKWERISDHMHYCRQHTHKIHSRALCSLKQAVVCDTPSLLD